MKVYLAAPYSWREKIKLYSDELKDKGFEITSRWLDEETPATIEQNDIPHEHNAEMAGRDVADIKDCEIFILFTLGEDDLNNISIEALARGGRHFETGLACGLGKHVVLCGSIRENVFHFLPFLFHREEWAATKKYLVHFKNSRRTEWEDWTGRQFGLRTALVPFTDLAWLCHCSCGTTDVVSSHDLRTGAANSCGCSCLNPDSAKQRIKKIYVYAANKRNLLWELSDDQFYSLVSQNCFFCNESPSNCLTYGASEKYKRTFVYSGIDRLDNSQGYTIDNCVSCCKTCNLAKRKMSAEDFVKWAKKVVSHSKNKARVTT